LCELYILNSIKSSRTNGFMLFTLNQKCSLNGCILMYW